MPIAVGGRWFAFRVCRYRFASKQPVKFKTRRHEAGQGLIASVLTVRQKELEHEASTHDTPHTFHPFRIRRACRQGRPANFYYLADASEGYEAVCEEVLEALNEPFPEMPNYGLSNDRNAWDLRYARLDLNNDSVEEDILITIDNLHSQPVHGFAISTLGQLPDGFEALTDAHRRTLIASAAFQNGNAIGDQIAREIWKTYKEYDVYKPDSLMVFDPFLDVVQFESKHYFLFTNSGPYARTRDVFLFDVHSDYTISPACRLVSRYSVVR
jgi:hypothetical protein